MFDALTDPKLNDGLTDTSKVAQCLFDTLQLEELPLRLPTGTDAYNAIKAKEMAKMEELERWREITESLGPATIPT